MTNKEFKRIDNDIWETTKHSKILLKLKIKTLI
jgi:hypothetical protein